MLFICLQAPLKHDDCVECDAEKVAEADDLEVTQASPLPLVSQNSDVALKRHDSVEVAVVRSDEKEKEDESSQEQASCMDSLRLLCDCKMIQITPLIFMRSMGLCMMYSLLMGFFTMLIN